MLASAFRLPLVSLAGRLQHAFAGLVPRLTMAPAVAAPASAGPLARINAVLAPPSTAEASLLDMAILWVKRTFQPSLIRRKRKHGFLARQSTRHGVKVMQRRVRKGRTRLCA